MPGVEKDATTTEEGAMRGVGWMGICSVTVLALTVGTSPAPAQTATVDVALIRQDSSDCTNSTVKDDPNRTNGGKLWLTRNANGTTTVRVGMTVQPNTTYHLYLKCVRQLGDIQTDGDGIGLASFDFPTSSVGAVYGFDMYPTGAPPGNKYQSVTVSFH